MSFYFPVGPFGPICDLNQPDDIIRRRGRPAQEEDDDDGRIDTFPPLDPDNWLPQFDLFDPPPPWITNRKCKVRTLDDGSLEYYDCIYEYLSDIPDIPFVNDQLDRGLKNIDPGENFTVPDFGPDTCAPFDPDINIKPIKFFLSNGKTLSKYKRQKSTPVTFPVDSDYVFSTNASTVSVAFDATSQNLVATGTGTGIVNLKLKWDDNPNTNGTAVSTIAVAGKIWTQTSGKEKGSQSESITVTAGTSYPITYTGLHPANNPIIQNGSTELCLKDGDGTDCNARFYVTSTNQQTTVSNASYWSDTGNALAVWVNPEVCTLPFQTQTINYEIDIPTSGTYGFEFGVDDTATVTINDNDVLFNNVAGGIFRGGALSTPYTVTRTLTAGVMPMTVVITNSAAGFTSVDEDGNTIPTPNSLAFSWSRNPGGYYMKICRGGACISGNSNPWVKSGPHPAWGDFMDTYAVYPSANDVLTGTTHTATWNVNIPFTGDYQLEYSADNVGNILLDGTNVAANFGNFTTSATTTLSNLSQGPHVITGTIVNTPPADLGQNEWTKNPAGLAWVLRQSNAGVSVAANFKKNGDLKVTGNGTADLVLNFAWNENTQSQTTTSNITASFNNGTGLVVGGTGTGQVVLEFEWDDNPAAWKQALGSWTNGGVGFVQPDQEEGSITKTLYNKAAGTYKTIIDGNTGSIVRQNNNKDLVFDDNPSNGFDTNATLRIESGDATFNSNGDLVVATAGNIELRFFWDDNPNSSGKAINHIVVGVEDNIFFTQDDGQRSGTKQLTLSVEAGKTYGGVLTNQTGGYRIEGNQTRVCFFDNDGDDCNANLRIKTITNDSVTNTANPDTALGTYRVRNASFVQSGESGSASATIRVQAGTTYASTIFNNPYGVVRQSNNQQLGFKDSGGVKATVTIGTITPVAAADVASSLDINANNKDGNLIWTTRDGVGYEYYEIEE